MSTVPRKIMMRSTAKLQAANRNARTHSAKQLRKIADSIQRFGFVTPILIDGDGKIVAGHGRWAAAKKLGLEKVPTLTLDHLGPEELRAYAIADNQLAALAGWDKELLSLELAEIELAMPELELTITGFEIEQIELLKDVAGSRRPSLEPSLVLEIAPAVSKAGDLWDIGHHVLLCGDALLDESYQKLLGDQKADQVITDPPFNVPIAGHVTSRSAHREFAMASGEMSREEFQRFLSGMCRQLTRHSRLGSLHYICMNWRSIADLIGAGEQYYDELLNLLVWVKPNGGMGTLYRSRHELIALFRNGSTRHINNVELGANGRNRTNVWEYAGISGYGANRHLGALHPTVKNLDMIADAIRDASRPNGVILDPFGGSGTTLLAAQQTGRAARLIELDPIYCDVIIRRALEAGLSVTLRDTNEPFHLVESARANSHNVAAMCHE
jgi:DNA modification methylase